MKPDLFERLRNLCMSLCPEPNGEWSVLDSFNDKAWFGRTPDEAISNAEQDNQPLSIVPVLPGE